MKLYKLIIAMAILNGCAVTQDGIVVDLPNVPTLNICANVANDTDIATMKSKIAKEAYNDDRLKTAQFVTKDYCFVSAQVVLIMEEFAYDKSRLQIAKDLYDQTTDKSNYDIVVDAITHKSNKDELKEFIMNNP
ncbi:MAG: DUF4476 domain-containing protein [Crocinitomicaceae bacterium]|nr:DUF4476 domain-containing protein [Crocinitomicaceae bacterium]